MPSNHMALGVKSLGKISHYTRADEKLMTLVAPLDSWVAAIGIPLTSVVNGHGHDAYFDHKLIPLKTGSKGIIL